MCVIREDHVTPRKRGKDEREDTNYHIDIMASLNFLSKMVMCFCGLVIC